ncbi:2-hydroxymuconate tautomerase family protein [Psychroflexus sp. MES1-P1E]|uniref:2-hydroxymuconate tautomerase family protein n=1 Tax=Psychroflexus sp. MES1-P1E TaxID=2058320 RepID=UPI000C7C308B|nr:2-hydroxymuconate tautomerase family protein [Psychroflexus sp. MES1-P1E]PKG42908.1 hypothetical protein CXF67_07795 [Psychroflexus sp. MES1-P1E]
MNKPNLKFALTMAFVVTSYISFILVAINAGFDDGFMILWLRSWLIAYLLAVPSLLFLSPIIRKKYIIMPYINIKITKEGATSKQKAELIEGITFLLQKILNKNRGTIFVILDEVETDNWGIAGEQVTIRRKREN